MKQATHFLVIFSIICLLSLLTCGTALADEIDLTINTGNITITVTDTNEMKIAQDGGFTYLNEEISSTVINISQTGVGSLGSSISIIGNGVLTTDPIQIKIQNLNLAPTDASPIALKNNANVKLILDGDDNVLKGGAIGAAGLAGINIPEDCEILITSLGIEKKQIEAEGGSGNGAWYGSSGSGIGGNGGAYEAHGEKSGIIKIENAIIYANGGYSIWDGSGSGIGGGGGGRNNAGSGGNGGDSSITIIVNSEIHAVGGFSDGGGGGGGSGIGGGGGGDAGPVNNLCGGNGGSITIINSEIYAVGGTGNAGGGGSGIGGGGGGYNENGGNGGSIVITDSKIYAVNGKGINDGGDGSGIGGGGGGYDSTIFGGDGYGSNGGDSGSIIISGEKADVIVLSGGIGSGYRGTGNIGSGNDGIGIAYIESGNVLILDNNQGNEYFNYPNGPQVYPITFSVGGNSNANDKLSEVTVSANGDSYKATTRDDAFTKLNGFGIDLSSYSSLFDEGTVTVWLPENYNGQIIFTYLGISYLLNDNGIQDIYLNQLNKIKKGSTTIGYARIVDPAGESSQIPEPLEAEVNPIDVPSQNEQSKMDLSNSDKTETDSKSITLIIIAIGAILVAGIGAYFYKKNK